MSREVLTPKRRELIAGLEKVGGSITAPEGSQLNPLEVMDALGMSGLKPGPWSAFLRSAEDAGIIHRTVKGRATKAIFLVHGGETDKNGDRIYRPKKKSGPKSKAKAGTKRKYVRKVPLQPRQSRRRLSLPLPGIDTTLTVFSLSKDAEGIVTVACRNETGSWAFEIKGYVSATQ